MDKALYVYGRAMLAYQTPTTDFPSHADGLEAACSDLIGVTGLASMEHQGATVPPFTESDCASVAAAAAAVEVPPPPFPFPTSTLFQTPMARAYFWVVHHTHSSLFLFVAIFLVVAPAGKPVRIPISV